MGPHAHAKGRDAGIARRGGLGLALLLALVGSLIAAQSAAATFHIMQIREVYSGTADNSSYVELQMYESGQNFVSGHSVVVYSNAGAELGTFTFTGSVPSGTNQKTILVGDDGVAAAFGGETPDLVNASFNVPASGGAACFDSIDCVAWGNFSGGTPAGVGSPAAPAGLPAGMAIRRTITGGSCSNQLDGGDDTNVSSTDFTVQTPNPRNNASAVEEGSPCTPPASGPTVTIGSKPAAKTKLQSAEFSFSSTPGGATFECKLDAEPTFTSCTTPKSYPGPLAGGSHTFQVKGTNLNGTGPIASYTWEVDLTAPTTTISNPKPPTPNSGASLTFKYSASESGSTFQCSLAKVGDPDGFSGCPTTGKTYSALGDGNYVFKVKATDPAGNEGSAAEYPLTVDTSLKDTTDPDTTIVNKPPDPSNSTTAEFTYQSTEPGSTFECKLDAAAFVVCPAGGISYTGLGAGQHTFQVRAKDASENVDESPAGYSFSIVLPAVQPEVKPPDNPPPPPSAGAPDTKLTKKPKAKTRDRTPTFKFTATAAGATFECQLDGKAFKACRSPLTTKGLKPGRHSFKVRAVAGGLTDPSPASSSFKVVKGR